MLQQKKSFFWEISILLFRVPILAAGGPYWGQFITFMYGDQNVFYKASVAFEFKELRWNNWGHLLKLDGTSFGVVKVQVEVSLSQNIDQVIEPKYIVVFLYF